MISSWEFMITGYRNARRRVWVDFGDGDGIWSEQPPLQRPPRSLGTPRRLPREVWIPPETAS